MTGQDGDDDLEFLRRLGEELADEVLSSDPKECVDAARADGLDVAARAAQTRAFIAKPGAVVGKARLRAARARLDAARAGRAPVPAAGRTAAENRARLDRMLAGIPDLTMAARGGKQATDADVELLLQQLDELGYKDPGD